MPSQTEDLKLTLQLTAVEDHLLVQASSARGESKAQTMLPSDTLLTQLARQTSPTIPTPTLKSGGQTLYQTLLTGDVAPLAADILTDGRRANQPVHIELRFDADQIALAQYPWEIIADAAGQFLVRDGLVDLTRYINYPQPPPAFGASLKGLPLVQVVSQPPQLPVVVIEALKLEKVETLKPATFEQLMYRLLVERLASWGLQFSGYGALMLQCRMCESLNPLNATTCNQCESELSPDHPVGALAFEQDGQVDWVSTKEVGNILYNAKVQLALLLSSETALVDDRVVFNGLASGLILAGVPAALGMQYPVSSSFAGNFLNSFYLTLLQEHDVVAALRMARRISMRSAWYSPTLYLRHQKAPPPAEPPTTAYHTRTIDTAVPAEVQVRVPFLVRLWIRRPETKPSSDAQLRAELDIPEHVPIRSGETDVDLKFEPVVGRQLRRGEVDVRLSSTECDVTPESIKLFVDEDVDAPAAIFTVTPRQPGHSVLVFQVEQDGGQVATITHTIQVLESDQAGIGLVQDWSYDMPLGDIPEVVTPKYEDHLKQLLINYQRYLNKLKEQQALFGSHTPPYILIQIEDLEAKVEELYARLDLLRTSKPAMEPEPEPKSGPGQVEDTPAGPTLESTQEPESLLSPPDKPIQAISLDLDKADPDALQAEQSKIKEQLSQYQAHLEEIEHRLNPPPTVTAAGVPPDERIELLKKRADLSQQAASLAEQLGLVESLLKTVTPPDPSAPEPQGCLPTILRWLTKTGLVLLCGLMLWLFWS